MGKKQQQKAQAARGLHQADNQRRSAQRKAAKDQRRAYGDETWRRDLEREQAVAAACSSERALTNARVHRVQCAAAGAGHARQGRGGRRQLHVPRHLRSNGGERIARLCVSMCVHPWRKEVWFFITVLPATRAL
jgi:hypothetical protein